MPLAADDVVIALTTARGFAAAWVLTLASCTSAPSANGPLISLELAGNGVGFVISRPRGLNCPGNCTMRVAPLTELSLEASSAAAGSTFVGWSGACAGLDLCVLTPSADVSLTAAFALRNSLVVTRAGGGRGTVSSEPPGIECGDDCSELFAPATEVTLTATPEPGTTFEGWSGACAGLDPCVVGTAEAQLVTATFRPVQRLLTVEVSGAGGATVVSTPAGISCPGRCAAEFNAGSAVTLQANGSTGSTVAWGGACSGAAKSCVVVLNQATTVTARFELPQQLALTPATKLLFPGQQFRFIASGGQPPYRFNLMNGPGTIDSTGLYTAVSQPGTAAAIVGVQDAAGSFANAQLKMRSTMFYNGLSIGSEAPTEIISGDWNRDGRSDIAVLSLGNVVTSLAPNFVQSSPRPVGLGGGQMATGDWNGDGKPDLAVTNTTEVKVLLGVGDGTFAPAATTPSGSQPFGVGTADFNNDGLSDLVVASLSVDGVNVLLGRGDGTFQAPIVTACSGICARVATGDWNRDGKTDLAVTMGGQFVRVLLGLGNGAFGAGTVDLAVPQGVGALRTSDLDGDGVADLVAVGSLQGQISVFLGAGDGTFRSAPQLGSGRTTSALVIGDWDGDGHADLAVAAAMTSAVDIYMGLGDGTFSTAPAQGFGPPQAMPAALTVGDWDGDSRLGLAVANRGGGTLQLLINPP